ncbi:MAG: Panacea domain-containing protein [Desulfovibrionaceae bacterium]|nr:Panacea domain-containing protein [Desulfovibrionaceae bacterium]
MPPSSTLTAKLQNAIIFFIKQDRTVKLTKLMKLLYYLDFRHYRETGHSVTGQVYTAWPKGPVPVDVWAEIRNSADRNCGVRNIVTILPTDPNTDDFGFDLRLRSGQRFDDYYFTKRELKILHEVSEIFKGVAANKIVDATHMPGQPWKKTWETKGQDAVIDYDLVLEGCDEEYIRDIKEEQRDRQALSDFFGTAL